MPPAPRTQALPHEPTWLEKHDSALIDFGSGGAQQLANVRVFIFGVLLAISLAFQATTEEALSASTSVMATTGLSIALFISWRIRSNTTNSGSVGYWLTTTDVSLVSGILISFALAGRPSVAAHSMFVWELYLLAVMLSVIQFDLRVVLFSGAMAALQWGAVLYWVTSTYPMPEGYTVKASDAEFVQILRFVLIGVFTAGAGLIVARTGRLMRLSGTDALTGLANRAMLDQRLVEEVAAARRWARPLSVAFLDIDHFKKFNDRWGHVAGDEALRSTARALIEESRESDVVARWGGEEFVVVLPDAGAKDAEMAVERLRARLAVMPISGIAPDVRVKLSAGIAEFPADADNAGSLEQIADRRLLAAKRRGRDCVVARD